MALPVSVLLPVYNGSEMLPACLESINNQSFGDFEIILVDDGSTDQTELVASAWAKKDPRLRYTRIEHGGIVAALNSGLRLCRGDYIARMDVDDLMLPHRLEKQLAHCKATPALDLIGCHVQPYGIDKALSQGGIRYHQLLNTMCSGADILTGIFVDSPLAHSTFFGRRELFDRLGGYQRHQWAEDYDFILRAARTGAKFGTVPEVLLKRGDHTGRLTRHDPRYKRKAMFDLKARHLVEGDWLKGFTDVMIMGSGPSGRTLAESLQTRGVPIFGFSDNREGPPDRTVMGFPAFGFPDGPPLEFLTSHQKTFFALCIGRDQERLNLTRRLTDAGLKAGRHFFRFI